MATFNDLNGGSWAITIHVGTIRRVREQTGVNLAGILEGDLLERLSGDPVLLCDVLWSLLAEQAQQRAITPETFAALLAGDTIGQATDALLEAIAAFFPSQKRRILQAAFQRLREVQTRMQQNLIDRLEQIDPVAEATRALEASASGD